MGTMFRENVRKCSGELFGGKVRVKRLGNARITVHDYKSLRAAVMIL